MKSWKNILFLFACTGGALFSGCAEKQMPEFSEKSVLIDVRTREEFQSGHLKGAKLIPYDQIGDKITETVPDKTTPVFLYCRSGRRAGTALSVLQKMGYSTLRNLGGLDEASRILNISVVKE